MTRALEALCACVRRVPGGQATLFLLRVWHKQMGMDETETETVTERDRERDRERQRIVADSGSTERVVVWRHPRRQGRREAVRVDAYVCVPAVGPVNVVHAHMAE